MQLLPLTNLGAPHLSTRKARDPKKKSRGMHAFCHGVERLQGQLRAVTRCVWGLTIGSGPLILGSPSFVASGLDGLWGRLLLSRNGRVADPHRVCGGGVCSIRRRDLVLGHANEDFLHFVILVLHYYGAMLPSASFLRKSSKHSKAQILHPMKTPLKPKARRTRLVACNGMGTSAVSLLCNCELDTLALW
jgi:hypothetical protein